MNSEFRIQKSEFKSGNDLYARLKQFALRIMRLYSSLPQQTQAQVIGKQMLRSGTSVGAQFAEARRARSKAEFESKLQGALQELEETGYWLELLIASGIMPQRMLESICREQNELTAILVTSINKSKNRLT